jgi:hypothetical protein
MIHSLSLDTIIQLIREDGFKNYAIFNGDCSELDILGSEKTVPLRIFDGADENLTADHLKKSFETVFSTGFFNVRLKLVKTSHSEGVRIFKTSFNNNFNTQTIVLPPAQQTINGFGSINEYEDNIQRVRAKLKEELMGDVQLHKLQLENERVLMIKDFKMERLEEENKDLKDDQKTIDDLRLKKNNMADEWATIGSKLFLKTAKNIPQLSGLFAPTTEKEINDNDKTEL